MAAIADINDRLASMHNSFAHPSAAAPIPFGRDSLAMALTAQRESSDSYPELVFDFSYFDDDNEEEGDLFREEQSTT